MESFLSLFIFHDSYVVTFLVLGITIIVVLLLLFNQKSPESVVKSEMGGSDNIEGALRRVLGEQKWVGGAGASGPADAGKVNALEEEVLEKDRTIAELNKQLTQSAGGEGGGATGDGSDLMNKIAELESRLQEYEIIEDDIADLSLYRTENEKLKQELERLKSMAGDAATDVKAVEPTAEVAAVVQPEAEESVPEVVVDSGEEESAPATGTDLVAEFEKVVNNQDQLSDDTDSSVAVNEENEDGKVLMAEQIAQSVGETEVEDAIHPKLKNINPDSKEEAEVFISDLKSLKKAQQK